MRTFEARNVSEFGMIELRNPETGEWERVTLAEFKKRVDFPKPCLEKEAKR